MGKIGQLKKAGLQTLKILASTIRPMSKLVEKPLNTTTKAHTKASSWLFCVAYEARNFFQLPRNPTYSSPC
jgi:hypothetical protein